jgi:3-oxoacyl-(acyl-carrier-protein) synthase
MKNEDNIRIERGQVLLRGDEYFRQEGEDFSGFSKALYRHLEPGYPKFFKMSPLSKLGFLAAELLLRGEDLSGVDKEKVILVLANRSSSLHTDAIYQESIATKPSPAIFVYTLPNIVIGEICIRHGFKGEGIFFIEEAFSKQRSLEYAREELTAGRASMALAGWMEMDMEGNYLADLDMLR